MEGGHEGIDVVRVVGVELGLYDRFGSGAWFSLR
jgi:hypothetical protein